MAIESKSLSQIPLVRPSVPLVNTIDGRMVLIEDGYPATILMFLCNHCPYVKHIWDACLALGDEAAGQGCQVLAVSSNDVEKYPADSPDKMKDLALQSKMSFPYLYDKDQLWARNFDAACTPEFYVFNQNFELCYHGAFDDARPSSNTPVTGRFLKGAIEHILKTQTAVPPPHTPALGCSIKFRS